MQAGYYYDVCVIVQVLARKQHEGSRAQVELPGIVGKTIAMEVGPQRGLAGWFRKRAPMHQMRMKHVYSIIQ